MNNARTEDDFWHRYELLPTEPLAKATWTTILVLYLYMLRGYRRYLRTVMAKRNQGLRGK